MECLGCGYDLRGLPVGRCPECAREFDPGDRWTFGPRDYSHLDRSVVMCGTASAAALVAFLALVHVARAAARLRLGHWPDAYVEAPRDLGGVVAFLKVVACVALASAPFLLLLTIGRMLVALIFGRWRAVLVVLLALTAAVLLAVCVRRLDPGDAIEWCLS